MSPRSSSLARSNRRTEGHMTSQQAPGVACCERWLWTQEGGMKTRTAAEEDNPKGLQRGGGGGGGEGKSLVKTKRQWGEQGSGRAH
mmetsp:Transcript_14459/g.30320  ORF Transcript_14459/g.30320 Transcript_14459/m.30320 type:complete len:86 (+) Transcript_14459:679-936(+)